MPGDSSVKYVQQDHETSCMADHCRTKYLIRLDEFGSVFLGVLH